MAETSMIRWNLKMFFDYEGQQIRLDRDKIFSHPNGHIYQDVLLSNTDKTLFIELEGKEIIVNTKKFSPFLNANFPQMNVQIQWLDVQRTDELNILIDIDNSLVSNKNEKIPLTLAQQKVLNVQNPKTFDFRYERDVIIKNLSKVARNFVR
ncbi:hypothetical protein [Acinetobacter pittii]|jgi:hypothetical protein|uniref:Uncharacterized protein n=1 Tax=Acinetobacter pittii ANC 4050 TaxID=1217691 RepID=R8YVG5_ACIPI|nr:hypothetical protein [Acinetobacter pittii]EOQ71492.1 hypothetical protein F931_00558 [Acinetobacter pittii ANC 4050]MCG9514336.1 hypothetical protein [Acinetobacter pittii]